MGRPDDMVLSTLSQNGVDAVNVCCIFTALAVVGA